MENVFAEDAITHCEKESDYWFLTSSHDTVFLYEGDEYKTIQHAYQAQKTYMAVDRYKVQYCSVPVYARINGHQIKCRADWKIINVNVMKKIMYEKFSQHENLKEQLISTGERDIISISHFYGGFWGVSPQGEGENNYGKCLMYIRRLLREGKKLPKVIQDIKTPTYFLTDFDEGE
jgi:N-glycosidase YbiA